LRTTKQLRNRILKQRQLTFKEGRGRQLRSTPPISQVPDKLKTDKMRILEIRYGKPIEVLITGGSLREVAREYGIKSHNLVSKWKNRLGLNWSESNLPNCYNCTLMDIICQTTGTCHVLMRSRSKELLILLKQKDVLNGS